MRSEFDLNKYVKSMDERGTYLTMENGHLNQKKQTMANTKKTTDKKTANPMNDSIGKKGRNFENVSPGPGAYETNESSVINK